MRVILIRDPEHVDLATFADRVARLARRVVQESDEGLQHAG